ncbi:hypothetical protein LX32DRAFT_643551 [Colletotrichum zoysiae]|uniref:Uncharacterized protein n=1 Tax=Colletotrichum zoysiae TaxID=1216348 RepID=A0AAD9LW87_9PEZI|nr:hypothetical protein LX32DRAFT_643551 [Colletotrichum zoysiae]
MICIRGSGYRRRLTLRCKSLLCWAAQISAGADIDAVTVCWRHEAEVETDAFATSHPEQQEKGILCASIALMESCSRWQGIPRSWIIEDCCERTRNWL